jgi:hypothetical protein
MKQLASYILEKGKLPTNAKDFLMASALTGALLTRDLDWAKRYWYTYKMKRFGNDRIPIFFQVIEAQIEI